MQKKVTVNLDTGTLELKVESGHIPLKRLLGFAARVNSKRKFLLVSKVLGKHYPVSPITMSWSYRALARAVLKDGIGESSVWIGMAETATGLGYGVFEAASLAGLKSALFIQTTRYHLETIERLEFQEAHSHATDFFLYYPQHPEYRERFLKAETLVLIDDEISTGKTFLRLIKAYQAVNPTLRKVFIVSLVNFAHPDDRIALETQAGVDVEWVCFRQGFMDFIACQNDVLENMTVNVLGNGACKKHLLAWPGRLGMAEPISLDTEVIEQLYLSGFKRNSEDTRPVLVLGTGECIAPAYLLGRTLERNGFKVKVQSTTRSPIHVGNDIKSACQFEDNYEDNIPNFIYNLEPEAYRDIVLCHETPLNQSIMNRLHAWQAISARFEIYPNNPHHAKLYFFRP